MYRRREGRGTDSSNETRFVTNKTKRVITLGDIDNFEVNPGSTIDLLRIASLQRIGSSVDLKTAVQRGLLKLQDRDKVEVIEEEICEAIIPAVLRDIEPQAATNFGDLIANELIRNTKTIITNYSVVEGDDIILVDASSGDITVTMPPAEELGGYHFIIKKIDSTNNAVITAALTGQTIDGENSQSIILQYNSITVISNNDNWFIV